MVATQEQVEQLTGVTVSAELVNQAQSIIELATNRTVPVSGAAWSTRDAGWFGRAIAYQAAWMAGQPDLFSRQDVASLSQDGVTVTYANQAYATTTGITLAPLAAKCIGRLSWRSTRSTSTKTGLWTSECAVWDNDDVTGWRPL